MCKQKRESRETVLSYLQLFVKFERGQTNLQVEARSSRSASTIHLRKVTQKVDRKCWLRHFATTNFITVF